MRLLPVLYGWLMRRKIARLYGELRFLEDEITGGGGPTDAVQLMARLDQLENQANQLKMPIAEIADSQLPEEAVNVFAESDVIHKSVPVKEPRA